MYGYGAGSGGGSQNVGDLPMEALSQLLDQKLHEVLSIRLEEQNQRLTAQFGSYMEALSERVQVVERRVDAAEQRWVACEGAMASVQQGKHECELIRAEMRDLKKAIVEGKSVPRGTGLVEGPQEKIIIQGLAEEGPEDDKDILKRTFCSMTVASAFLKGTMEVPFTSEGSVGVEIKDAHRLGKRVEGKGPRPLVVQLASQAQAIAVLSRKDKPMVEKLKSQKVRVDWFLNAEEKSRKDWLLKNNAVQSKISAALEAGQKVQWRRAALWINKAEVIVDDNGQIVEANEA